LYGFEIKTDLEFWSMIDESGLTYWGKLQKTGELIVQDGLFCIDFIYDLMVYADYAKSWYNKDLTELKSE